MADEDGCDGSLGIYTVFCVPDSDDVKQKNINHETIPSRMSLNRKQRSLLIYVICVQCMKFWLEFGTHRYQFIWSGKVYIWLWGVMNGPLKFLTARKILPLLNLLAEFKRLLVLPKFLRCSQSNFFYFCSCSQKNCSARHARKDHSSPLLWQPVVSTSSCMLRIQKLITFNMTCVDISYKFTLG